MTSKRRVGGKDSATRDLILDATEQLMVEIGYGAISTRKVAKKISVAPTLIHYYFPTTDDLLIELYRKTTRENTKLIEEALESEQPIRALWTWMEHPERNALGLEFLALANHRPTLRKEIATYIEESRKLLISRLNKLIKQKKIASGLDNLTPLTLTTLIAAVSRLVVVEHSIGLSYGHKETLSLVEELIDKV